MCKMRWFAFGLFLSVRWNLLIGLIWILGCGEQFSAQEYVAFADEAYWIFDGNFTNIEIIETIHVDSTDYTLRITNQYRKLILARFLGYQGQIFLSRINVLGFGHPNIHYDPPLAILPHTNRTGDVDVMDSAEIRDGDTEHPIRVRVHITVLQPLPFTLAEMRIDDILRIRINYTYIDPSELPFLAGESEWWFGRNIGLIRYQIGFTTYGDLVSCSTMPEQIEQR